MLLFLKVCCMYYDCQELLCREAVTTTGRRLQAFRGDFLAPRNLSSATRIGKVKIEWFNTSALRQVLHKDVDPPLLNQIYYGTATISLFTRRSTTNYSERAAFASEEEDTSLTSSKCGY